MWLCDPRSFDSFKEKLHGASENPDMAAAVFISTIYVLVVLAAEAQLQIATVWVFR